VSIGVTILNNSDENYDMALIRADDALYTAKANGRNCVKTKLR
jgi:PleD family two-component response regulator